MCPGVKSEGWFRWFAQPSSGVECRKHAQYFIFPPNTLFLAIHEPQMFIAALIIIAKTWNQPKCPSTDEWIKQLWYIYTMEYDLAIKRKTFKLVLMKWMNLEPITQSKVNQKDKYHILMHIYGI